MPRPSPRNPRRTYLSLERRRCMAPPENSGRANHIKRRVPPSRLERGAGQILFPLHDRSDDPCCHEVWIQRRRESRR